MTCVCFSTTTTTTTPGLNKTGCAGVSAMGLLLQVCTDWIPYHRPHPFQYSNHTYTAQHTPGPGAWVPQVVVRVWPLCT